MSHSGGETGTICGRRRLATHQTPDSSQRSRRERAQTVRCRSQELPEETGGCTREVRAAASLSRGGGGSAGRPEQPPTGCAPPGRCWTVHPFRKQAAHPPAPGWILHAAFSPFHVTLLYTLGRSNYRGAEIVSPLCRCLQFVSERFRRAGTIQAVGTPLYAWAPPSQMLQHPREAPG